MLLGLGVLGWQGWQGQNQSPVRTLTGHPKPSGKSLTFVVCCFVSVFAGGSCSGWWKVVFRYINQSVGLGMQHAQMASFSQQALTYPLEHPDSCMMITKSVAWAEAL